MLKGVGRTELPSLMSYLLSLNAARPSLPGYLAELAEAEEVEAAAKSNVEAATGRVAQAAPEHLSAWQQNIDKRVRRRMPLSRRRSLG